MDPKQGNLPFDFSAILLFFLIGLAFVMINMILTRLIHNKAYSKDKMRIYECGEPTIGTSWIRYNIRFYTIALVFLIFDVEVVFLFPVVLVLRKVGWTAFWEVMFFIGVLVFGLIYAWRFGNLDWIRSGMISLPEEQDAESKTPSAS
jgi:NADH-quinone oxidoreductase subunit A